MVSDVENSKNQRIVFSHVNFLSRRYNAMICWHYNDEIENSQEDIVFWITIYPCARTSSDGAKSFISVKLNKYKKAVLLQRWKRDAPYTWVPWKISGLSRYTHGYFSRNFSWAPLLFRTTLQNLKSVALPVSEIICVPQKLGSRWIRPHFFSPKF